MIETVRNLRVLIANERPERLAAAEAVVIEAGHEVVEATIEVAEIGRLTREIDPDVAIVAVGRSAEHALDQVEEIAEESSCPVIVLLDQHDPAFVAEAARRGVFASALDSSPDELQSSIEIALRRFEDLSELQSAFQRRAVIERAKGVLMERHLIDERDAFELLRGEARRRQEKLIRIAEAVLATHRLRPRDAGPAVPVPGAEEQ